MSLQFKLVVCGGGGVGKSCVTIRYVQGKFIKTYDPTIEDQYRKPITMKDQNIMLHICDTAGQEEYGSIRDSYLYTGDGFIIIYAVDSMTSFEQAKDLRSHIIKIKEKSDIPIIIVANKCDLVDRQVSVEQGEAFAKECCCPFIECSAKEDTRVSDVFMAAANAMLDQEEKKNAEKGIVKKKKKNCK